MIIEPANFHCNFKHSGGGMLHLHKGAVKAPVGNDRSAESQSP
jgi:hypothetical protein